MPGAYGIAKNSGLLDEKDIQRFEQQAAPFAIGAEDGGDDDDDEVSIPDKRRQIETGNKLAPWRCIGRLQGKFPDGKPIAGTGVLVGRAHVLTAAHNVFDARKGGYAAELEFRPGEWLKESLGKPLPFGSATAQKIWVPDAFKATRDISNEYGVVLLTYTFGDELGWLGILPAQDSFFRRRTFEMSAYPKDKPKGEVWSGPGRIRHLQPDQFEHSMSSDIGLSSGVIWTELNTSQLVVGLHIDIEFGSRRGVRLNQTAYTTIAAKIQEMEPDSG